MADDKPEVTDGLGTNSRRHHDRSQRGRGDAESFMSPRGFGGSRGNGMNGLELVLCRLAVSGKTTRSLALTSPGRARTIRALRKR